MPTVAKNMQERAQDVRKLLRGIEAQAEYHDGLVTFPAFLLEQLHNTVFPGCEKREYTEPGEVIAGVITK